MYCIPPGNGMLVGESPCGGSTYCNPTAGTLSFGIEENDGDDELAICTSSGDCPVGQFCNAYDEPGDDYCTNYVSQACTPP